MQIKRRGRRRPASGSLTKMSSGIEKTAHHAATMPKDRRTASDASARPKDAGHSVIATLTVNKSPPPRYPRANPRQDTWCSRGSEATLTSSAS